MADLLDEDAGPPSLVLKVAKTLQGAHAKQLTGAQRVWRDVPPKEKEVWIRLARLADRLLSEQDTAVGTAAGAAKPSGSGQAAPAKLAPAKPAPAAPAEKASATPAKPPPPAVSKPVAAAPAASRPPAAAALPAATPRPSSKATKDALATLLRLKTPPRTEGS